MKRNARFTCLLGLIILGPECTLPAASVAATKELATKPVLAAETALRLPATAVGATAARTDLGLMAKTERLATDRAKLSISSQLGLGSKLRLLDPDGKEIAVTAANDGTLQATVDPRRSYVVMRPTAAVKVLPREGISFPARYVTFDQASVTNLGGLFLRPARVPLTWDDSTKSYSTELFVGYEFQDGAERSLATPKTVTFFADGTNARIKSDSVTIVRSGGAGYQRVVLSTGDFSGETHFTARASAVDEVKSSVVVQREPGALKLSLPSTEIPAFGVGSGVLTIGLLARDGAPLEAGQPIEVQLSSRRLRLPASVILPAGKSSVEVGFRSSGSGSDALTAQSGLLSAGQAIRLVFPVAAVVAAVVGGALGGVARYFRNKGKRGGLLVRRLIEGMLVGVILVGAAWAGLVTVELGAGILGTPFGAFVLAALGGYVGCVVLDWVAEKAFKGLRPVDEKRA